MNEEPEHIPTTALDLIVDRQRESAQQAAADAERAERARQNADECRLALAELAPMAVAVVACRLYGREYDPEGVLVTADREETAWELLSRVGVPKLRATAVAASIFAAPNSPAPGSPGWEPPEVEGADVEELDPSSVDAMIDSFFAGVKAQKDLGKENDK